MPRFIGVLKPLLIVSALVSVLSACHHYHGGHGYRDGGYYGSHHGYGGGYGGGYGRGYRGGYYR